MGPAPYESRLYSALGDLYVEKERFQDGAEVYRSFARRQPLDPAAPFLLGKATEAYGKAGFNALVLESKQELVELYGPRSAYWAQRGASIDPRVSAAVQANLLDLARHHHALAQKKGGEADRDAAVRWYREYLDGFDATAEAPATRLLLADLLLEGSRYSEAADEYEKAAYNYANAPEAGRAGYAALVALDKAAATLPESQRPALEQRAIESSLKFAATFPRARRNARRPDAHDQAAVRSGRPAACRVGRAKRARAWAARRRWPATRRLDGAGTHVLRLLALLRG